jgi:Flp pilus assembly protein TadG
VRSDKGTAVIELAMVMMIMLMLAIGAYEWGTGFGDRIAMTSSVREAARVGSAAGNISQADCRIIEAAAGSLSGVSGNVVKQLWIYESDINGSVTTERQVYRPAVGSEPGLSCSGGTWFQSANAWPPSERVSSGAARDWLGVKVIADHAWKTGFLWWNGSVEWQEDAVFHIEPAVVS